MNEVKLEHLLPELTPAEGKALEVLWRLSDEQFDAGQFENSATIMRVFSFLFPDDPRVLGNLGMALVCAGKHEEGLCHMERHALLAPHHVPCWLRYGAALVKSGKTLAAFAAFKKALSLESQNVDAMTMVAGTMMALNQSSAEAEKLLRQAIRLNPSHAGAWAHLGIALRCRKKWTEAEQAFKAAISLQPPPVVLQVIQEELRRLNYGGCLALNDTHIALGEDTPLTIKSGV